MGSIRAHVIVEGRVQGVFFRKSTCEQAEALSVVGTVRNCSDGSVEVVVEGEQSSVEQLIEFLHQGPENAEVQRVRVEMFDAQNEFTDFSIVR